MSRPSLHCESIVKRGGRTLKRVEPFIKRILPLDTALSPVFRS